MESLQGSSPWFGSVEVWKDDPKGPVDLGPFPPPWHQIILGKRPLSLPAFIYIADLRVREGGSGKLEFFFIQYVDFGHQ